MIFTVYSHVLSSISNYLAYQNLRFAGSVHFYHLNGSCSPFNFQDFRLPYVVNIDFWQYEVEVFLKKRKHINIQPT